MRSTRYRHVAMGLMGASLALCGAAVFMPGVAGASVRGGPAWFRGNGPAVFVQTDNPAGNQILSYQRTWNGQLTGGMAYDTGGDGAIAAQSVVDPLASQGSVQLADQGQVLLTVNAGSDTISVFQVYGSALALSQIVPSGGQFPASIAVHGNLVYVLNSGGAGSIQGYGLFGGRLWPLWGSNRTLGLANTNPPFFLDAPGQIGFSPDGAHLIVTTKGSGSDIDVFSVGFFGWVGAHPTVNAAAAPVPFGFTFGSLGNLVVTEAGGSDLTSYAIDPNGTLTTLGSAGDGQAALCWVTGVDGFFYGSNAGSATVSQFSENGAGVPQVVGAAASTSSGATDSAASSDGRFLYVEEGGAGSVTEFQIGGGGSLTPIGEVTGLHSPMEGIAAS
jgi:hypothetical protein